MIPLWVIGAAAKAWGFLKSNPLLALCLLLACWSIYERHQHTSWRDYAHRLESASQAAREAQEALRAKERADYERKADEGQRHHATIVPAVRTATDSFVQSRRVRTNDSSPAQPIGQADPAAVCEGVPAGSIVVSEADVRAAADWQAYGVALHDWALSVGE